MPWQHEHSSVLIMLNFLVTPFAASSKVNITLVVTSLPVRAVFASIPPKLEKILPKMSSKPPPKPLNPPA